MHIGWSPKAFARRVTNGRALFSGLDSIDMRFELNKSYVHESYYYSVCSPRAMPNDQTAQGSRKK